MTWPPAASIAAWIVCLAALSPAIWRMARRRGRYLDPVWGLVFLLAANRLSFLLFDAEAFSRATAAALAIVMAVVSTSYQKDDK